MTFLVMSNLFLFFSIFNKSMGWRRYAGVAAIKDKVKLRKPKGPITPKPSPLFGPFVLSLRIGSGLSRDQFATEVGVEMDNLSRWENDRAIPKREHWQKMLALHKPPLKMSQCLKIPSEDDRLRKLELRIDDLQARMDQKQAHGSGKDVGGRKAAQH